MTEQLNWYALLTKSNFEQTVYNSIAKKSVEAFLPRMKKKSRRKDRNLVINVPLFPGYIFVKISPEPADQLNILKTTGAVRMLGSQAGPVQVPEKQIEALRIMTCSDMDLVTGTDLKLVKGDPVMILKGPLAGVQGEFIHYKGKGRVAIKIDALGQFAGVTVDEENVEKLPHLTP